MSVWGLEPFFGGSHRYFLEGLATHSVHDFRLHTLPGRYWAWRMHGGAVPLANADADEDGPAPAVLFASSMLDLPLYRALAAAPVGRRPALVYFHENQLTYPLPEGARRDLGYAWKNLTTALSADRVAFNSRYHRDEFMTAATSFLKRLPDCVPEGLLQSIATKSVVLPLGVDLRRFDSFRPAVESSPAPDEGPLILWNQRWEYDKAPGDIAEALLTLAKEGLRFRVALAGKSHGPTPPGFQLLREVLGGRLVQFGEVEAFADYARLLWEADIVVSAALHEFFGQAAVEAIYCGCRPVLPRRLSYPELIPPEARDAVLYEEGDLIPALRAAVRRGREWSLDWQRTWVARFDWGAIVSRYDDEIWRLWEKAGGKGGRVDAQG
ncbi:MAG: DUF3524 domain-containing protein [Actinobacteria bacterium]|nr:DUF3524 domain-containing protein [Actinomycetota bacterium]